MKLSELHKIALEKGADPAALDNALDSDNPRDAINAVIRSLGDSPRRLRVHAAGSPRRRPGRGSPRKGFNRYDPTTRTYTVAGIGDKAVWQKFLLCHMISSPRSGIISKEEDAAWGACKGSDGRLEYFNTVTGTTVREPPAAAMSPMTRARAAAAAKDQTAGATGMASEFFNVDVDENLRKFYEDNGVQSFEGVLAKLGVMNLRDLDEVSDELFDSVPGLTIIHRKRIRRELPKVLEVAGEAGKYRAVGAISTEQSDGRMRSAMRNFVASHSERVHKLEAELGFLNVTEPNSEKVLPAGVTKPVTMEDGHLDVEQVRLENGEQEERQKQATQKEKEEKAAVVIQTRARAALSRKQYLRTMVAEEDFVGQEEGDLSFLEGELIVVVTNNLADLDHDGTWLTGFRKEDPDKKTGQFPSNFMRKAVSKKAPAAPRPAVENATGKLPAAGSTVSQATAAALEPPPGLGIFERLQWVREHSQGGPVATTSSAATDLPPEAQPRLADLGSSIDGPPPQGHGVPLPEQEQQHAQHAGIYLDVT